MNLKNKLLVSLIFLIPVTTSCSSDPYPNAGKCETPGESKSVDERVAVCTGIEGKSKWYFAGKYFDETLLLAKLEYLDYALDDAFFKKLEDEKLTDSFFEIDKSQSLTTEDIAKFANGESRWDKLIESQSIISKEQDKEEYLFDYWTTVGEDKRSGNATHAQWDSARRDWLAQTRYNSELREDFKTTAEPLRATLSTRYSIYDKEAMFIFFARYVKYPPV